VFVVEMDLTEESEDQQLMEFETLQSIYIDDFVDLFTTPRSCRIALKNLSFQEEDQVIIQLGFVLPPEYPDICPTIEIISRSEQITSSLRNELMKHLENIALKSLGDPCIYTIVDEASDWLNSNFQFHQTNQEKDQNEEEEEEDTKKTFKQSSFEAPKPSGGKWNYVIGLVGKPSAGKSTFFNALTRSDVAKTSQYPFTTIDPNMSSAFYSISDPSLLLGVVSQPEHGKIEVDARLQEVLLKDVAGLVPGAWEGKGRGNRFLNDLCDADVLIHVIDASGTTDQSGETCENYDPCDDVIWLREEIIMWIFSNIINRLETLKRRPEKLPEMFTGYHASKQLISTVFQQADIPISSLDELPEEIKLRHLVSTFVQIRFPILLVFNKCDHPKSAANIEKLTKKFNDISHIAVSSLSEFHLQDLNRRNLIDYNPYKKITHLKCHLHPDSDEETLNTIQKIQSNVFDQ